MNDTAMKDLSEIPCWHHRYCLAGSGIVSDVQPESAWVLATHRMLRTQIKMGIFLATGTMQMVLLVSTPLAVLLWAGIYRTYTQLPFLSMKSGPSRTFVLETCTKQPGGRFWAQVHSDRTIL